MDIDLLLAQVTFPGFAAICFAWMFFGVALWLNQRSALALLFVFFMFSLMATWGMVAIGTGDVRFAVWYRSAVRLLWAWDFLLSCTYTVIYLFSSWKLIHSAGHSSQEGN